MQQQSVADVPERYREEMLLTLAATALTSDPFRVMALVEHLGRVSLAHLSPSRVSRYRQTMSKGSFWRAWSRLPLCSPWWSSRWRPGCMRQSKICDMRRERIHWQSHTLGIFK